MSKPGLTLRPKEPEPAVETDLALGGAAGTEAGSQTPQTFVRPKLMMYVIHETARLLTLELIQRRFAAGVRLITRQGQAGLRITGGQVTYDNA